MIWLTPMYYCIHHNSAQMNHKHIYRIRYHKYMLSCPMPHAPCLLNSPIIGTLSIYTIFSNVPLIYKSIEFFFFRKDGEIS